jgi:hypothetical protein
MSKRSKNSTSNAETSKRSEPEWVAADDGDAGAEPRIQGEHGDEHQLDVVQHAPDEAAWTPVEPQHASDATDEPRVAKKAPRAAGAKPARVGGSARKTVANDVAPEPARLNDAPAANTKKRAAKRSAAQSDDSNGTKKKVDAEERKETLSDDRVVEVATAATKPNAAGPKTKKRKIQEFVTKRGAQRVEEPAEEAAAELADLPPASGVGNLATGSAQDGAHAEAALEPDTSATAAPASTMQPMEDYLRELGTLSVAQLVARHVEVVGKKPKIKSRPWLVKKLGWIEQTKRYGGLSVAAKKKLEHLMSEIELPMPTTRAAKPTTKPPKSADDMPIGTRIERTWHGRLIVATRVPEGWSCEGQVFRTLSAAAKSVSGSHVSGPAWFKIWRPRAKGSAQ